MTRCDYDAVFYRVFCVTLLAIAFTFTVILTNVFIDIDGLLASNKEKHNIQMNENRDIIQDEFTSEATDTDELNYGDSENSYRTKRSIETQSFLFHIKNPKVKNLLANRLSTLLEELDAEEPNDIIPTEKKMNKDLPKDVELVDVAKLIEQKKEKVQQDDKMLHMTMHNILLQGIIGHMDLIDVYKKVNALIANFNEIHSNKEELRLKADKIPKLDDEKSKALSKQIEEKFINEMVNCNELQEQINRSTAIKVKEEVKKLSPIKAPPHVMIKTVINITSLDNDKLKEKFTKNSKGNIKGVIELIYNNNVIKFTHPDEIIQTPQQKPILNIVETKPIQTRKVMNETTTAKVPNYYKKVPKPYLDKFVEEYFKRFPNGYKDLVSTDIKENLETKRSKRQIKIRYDNDSSEEKVKKLKKTNKTEEDELYVEIETHFDSKGMKGEKKKKLIRGLIEKIQKAIHSDVDGKLNAKEKGKTKKREPIHFKKRIQNPLKHKNNHVLINKYSLPRDGIVHRQLNPISKTLPMQENSNYVGVFSKSGDEWKKPYIGPAFLAASKSINSAEMSELNVDYSKVLDVNGIPQRLQKPLNTELSEETIKTNSYYDVGKMKFFIKDIDGSGFSVGFNQYVDEPPDADTMGLFTGIENIIKTYHQNYDPADAASTTEAFSLTNVEEKAPDFSSPNNEHVIVRRSVNRKRDYHSNEYKIIFDHNYLPYDNYQDIFETQKPSKTNLGNGKRKHNINDLPMLLDQNVFEKNLNPAEIFSLANLFDRKKRSISVKKISNLKSKIKLNRYLNTKAMSTKRIFLNRRRNKRQINKIRIIARDLPQLSGHSDENVFLVSDENIFADRAIVKDTDTSEAEHDKQEEAEYIPIYPNDDSSPSTYVTKIFEGRSRHNPLMSKYPHIFMEEVSRSREQYIPDNALLFGKLPGLGKYNLRNEAGKAEEKVVEEHTNEAPVDSDVTELPKLPEDTPSPKTNYKVIVKIVPKNNTGLNSGFKEIHTSINKRFNKNGLLYSSLMNVSEISNIVKLNRSKDGEYKGQQVGDNFLAKKIKEQQDKMQYLLKQHAKHINEQLSRLNEEKTNLEYMLDSDNLTDIQYQDYDSILKPPKDQIPVPSKEVNIKKTDPLREKPSTSTQTTVEVPAITTTLTTTPPPTPTTTPTTLPPPPSSTPPPFTDTVKKNILSTIERNGNLTDLILTKIDKNTEILKEFLKKITDKIQVVNPTTTLKPVEAKDEEKVTKYDMNSYPPDWTNKGGMQFNQNLVIRKNDSHISIPFVYTYHNPMQAHQSSAPVTNLVYHGHIHTNSIHPKDIPASPEKEKINTVHKIQEPNNQSRFFIDDLENDYKVIQVGDLKNTHSYNSINNSTVS